MSFFDIFRGKEYKQKLEETIARESDLSGKLEEKEERLRELESLITPELKDIQSKQQKIKELDEICKNKEDEVFKIDNEKSLKVVELDLLKQNANNQIEEIEKNNNLIQREKRKIVKMKNLYKSIQHAINKFFKKELALQEIELPLEDIEFQEELEPEIRLKLHAMDLKDLRKLYNDNMKQINEVLEKYKSRYTTKANIAIYNLMVIALKSELQNVLYNLKFEKLDNALTHIDNIIKKYYSIAIEGNKSIAPTMLQFIGQIEYLFSNAIKIEYEFYVKRAREREEQSALREQMRQESEERKELERQKKLVEKEEEKFINEIKSLSRTLEEEKGDSEQYNLLIQRIKELENQLKTVELKKEEITNLQNGKAGHVYVISNLGAFGEDVFKIGMTRRLDPLDRVNELGSASVPFKFDIHSFIFSEDAVGLENRLHEILNNKRLNKVNLRKEFFRVNIDDLENIVTGIDPTAEFNRTMVAEQYRLSMDEDLEVLSI